MKLVSRYLCLMTLFSFAMPIFAGTVYVPLVTDVDQGGHRLTTEIRVLNTSTTDFQSFRFFLIPAGTDGTQRPSGEVGEEVLLAPGSSFLLRDLVAFGETGMVEITGPEAIHISSRLTSEMDQGLSLLGHEIPVISSDNLVPAGESAVLQGWSRTANDLRTDFHLVNRGFTPATCTANVYTSSGQPLASNVMFGQGALSLVSFEDVLSLLDVVEQVEISASFSCDRPFYPLSVTSSLITGEVVVVSPSASGRSALDPPVVVDPEPGVVVFERPGVFHRPTVGNESRRFNIPFPGNPVYSRIVLEMDFTHGGWFVDSDENHAVFWLSRGTRWRSNSFGYLNVFGPGANIMKLSTNANLDAGDVQAKTVSAFFAPGSTYHVRFEYNILQNFYEATVTQGDRVVGVIRDTPTVNQIRTVEENWFVDFGHDVEAAGPEVPTYDWRYANLQVRWIP